MRTSIERFGAALAAALALASTAALGCGVCIEDRVAAVFDNALVTGSVARSRHVAFFGVEGSLPATAQSRRALLDALYAAGGVPGTARVSLESASCSVAFDPGRTSLEALRAAAARRLASRQLSLTALRMIDEGGVLKEPLAAR